ncbi:hypothetical protein MGYG_02591 [Nannizzia gypsea CBS 118893]|uniref:Uncharacterized protein n=1 Tax=Arthroderma gypseum (strain ATCC MYA-4604 / CBS 118893) TaxID=535722 RepID=E4UNH1_ARTGP|nr:hypothetical protein MGYG_02591 [Nannizzia gypsea CBS 118893]EFQ99579.1 hypothetical protein MGYG_02591 [Nannizzia gypsea CBS 118893]
MPRSILLPQVFLPRSAVSLGRFVINLDDPLQDFHDPTSNASPDCAEKVQDQYSSIYYSAKHQNVASQLASFLSSSFSKRFNATVWLTADQAKTYYLNNAGQWFREVVRSQETREWIERTIDEGEDIYVVVAYHTLVGAQIQEQLRGNRAAGGNMAIPASTALAASGVVLPFNFVDSGIGGFCSRVEHEYRLFKAPGEQIYAVQYRKVAWRWFSSKKADEMTLAKKACWKRYDGPRSLHDEHDDIIEVELEGDFKLEGNYDECAIESGEIFVSTV